MGVDMKLSRRPWKMPSASASADLSTTLPTKPSQAMTSKFPFQMSRPSAFPSKWISRRRKAAAASLVTSVPLPSSSPTLSTPTRGREMPSTSSA